MYQWIPAYSRHLNLSMCGDSITDTERKENKLWWGWGWGEEGGGWEGVGGGGGPPASSAQVFQGMQAMLWHGRQTDTQADK